MAIFNFKSDVESVNVKTSEVDRKSFTTYSYENNAFTEVENLDLSEFTTIPDTPESSISLDSVQSYEEIIENIETLKEQGKQLQNEKSNYVKEVEDFITDVEEKLKDTSNIDRWMELGEGILIVEDLYHGVLTKEEYENRLITEHQRKALENMEYDLDTYVNSEEFLNQVSLYEETYIKVFEEITGKSYQEYTQKKEMNKSMLSIYDALIYSNQQEVKEL